MELWQQVLVNKWRRLDNTEVMGWEVARQARQLAEFFESICFSHYDHYHTSTFGDYVEAHIRGYQFNEQAYDDMNVTTTNDLHYVTCNSYGLHDFDYYMGCRWKDRFMYALDMGI